MACRSMLRSAMLVEPILHRPLNFNLNHYHIQFASRYNFNKLRTIRARQFHSTKSPLCCSHNETPSSHDDQDPPQEAVLKAISEVSKTEGRVGQTRNMIIGGTVSDDSINEWLALDQKVNSYPTVRGFTAIGTGGDDFVQAMVVAVESVIQQPVPQVFDQRVSRYEKTFKHALLFANMSCKRSIKSRLDGAQRVGKGHVKQKISSGGKYVSVNIGPIQVVSSEQVQAVYNAMRRDDRMKYFL